jgi:hypothetical protein
MSPRRWSPFSTLALLPLVSALPVSAASSGPPQAGGDPLVVDNSGNPTGPGINSPTENVDFGDVDLDGDWDAAFADGGNVFNDQNRLWINLGGLQGGALGQFADETAGRVPVISDTSRDIEFADLDQDGDLDVYVSNTAQIINQGDRFWTNVGGSQGGTLGYFVDDTALRWVGIGGPGSSVAPSLVLPLGNFIDWSCDSDFGDLDNDGDLDLVHSTYGGAFGGTVPTRLFLNDGQGRFSEFNPSGFQLPGTAIPAGSPALWAEGVQTSNTGDVSGAQADVAEDPLDIELADLDGDFDLDLLLGSLNGTPRIFRNNEVENGGSLGRFRDLTGLALPPGSAANSGNYEQEFGDLDGDGDLDLYGLNWAGFADRTFRGSGAATFSFWQDPVPDSAADDNESDFFDVDNDGDLDVVIANWSGLDKLYQNDGSGLLSLVQSFGVTGGAVSLDADAADIDGDGDYDLIVAEDNNRPNTTVKNVTEIADTTPPYLPRVENRGDRAAAPGAFPVRAQVYDNAAYYTTWYNPTAVELEVDGFALGERVARSSQGQIFRAELPANLVGAVSYRFRSADEYGNTGFSASESYTASTTLSFASTYGTGSAGPSGVPSLVALSVPFPSSSLFLGTVALTPGTPSFLVVTDASLPTFPLPGLGNLNVGGTLLLQVAGFASPSGQWVLEFPLGPSLPAGVSLFAQTLALGGTGGNLLATSNGLEFVTQ